MVSHRLLIDTSVLISYLRGEIDVELWRETLDGRAPVVSPVTLHELRRGIRPGSSWEKHIDELRPSDSILCSPPETADWVEAADLIRNHFWKTRGKAELATLTHDVLIALSARNIRAELWARDGDFKRLAETLGLGLISA